MASRIYPKNSQADGQFNGGAILEKKPIGFPQDGGGLKPYSSLFYWAHAWTDNGSTIGEHPHKGFEIMSFVLKGEIEHYDSNYQGWKKLMAGDAQIIRAGNGIHHAERMHAGSAMFQIWFDPDLSMSINKDASYDDYSSDKFPIIMEDGRSYKIYKGTDSPLEMDTQGITIYEVSLARGKHTLLADADSVFSAFVMEGKIHLDDQELQQEDFFIIENQQEFSLEAKSDVRLFTIASPARVPYQTYARMHGFS